MNKIIRIMALFLVLICILSVAGCRKLRWNAEEDTVSTYVKTEEITEDTGTTVDLDALREQNRSQAATAAKKEKLGSFSLLAPSHDILMTDSLTPTFTWEACENAKSYTLLIESFDANTGDSISALKKSGIKETSYKITAPLKEGTVYRWQVTAVGEGNATQQGIGEAEGLASNVFMSYMNFSNNAVNKGIDYKFDGMISEAVLKNYLSRSITYANEASESLDVSRTEALRTILYTGAKYVSRAASCWVPSKEYVAKWPAQKEFLSLAHSYDPDIIFEACIFENVTAAVNEIVIPQYVFEAFGLPIEQRNFSYEKMQFPDGTYVEENSCIPDVTQTETQLFFYYRMCEYIKCGFESFHMGQIMKIGRNDTNWEVYTNLLNMVRDFAKTNARRHFVMFNAHTHGITGSDGLLLLDFHAAPCRAQEPVDAVTHEIGENNPQEANLEFADDHIYGKSLGGTTHSGWSCESLPYYVELDNYSFAGTVLNRPNRGTMWVWGRDEISWFANQPDSYRRYWLSYAYNWVRDNDSQGFFCMPGRRSATILGALGGKRYVSDCSLLNRSGFDDYETIRNVWLSSVK